MRAIVGGAAVKGIRGSDLKLIKVHKPAISEQRAIRTVLSAYDDLIDNNQRRIQLLEDMARRLYREWFVHLRFPRYQSVRIKDGVPEDWTKIPLANAADFINGFAFKPAHQMEHGLPIVKIPELRDGVSSKTPRNHGVGIPERNKIDTGDVLFSWSATLLVTEWSEGPALLNQHLFKVVAKNTMNKRFIRFAIEDAIPTLLGHSVGATMQHIRRKALDDHKILLPHGPVREEFSAVIDPLMDQVLTLNAQNKRLTQARDLLIPRLMSGQLDVAGIAISEETAGWGS